jgi:ADP-heptose:LPS heptosyltransferase
MKKKENILIIKHGALGDLVQADGIFKSIRNKHINAKIILLTSKRFVNLMILSPHIDEVILDNRSSFFNIISYINLFKEISSYDFSVIYDLQNSQRTYIYRKYLFNMFRWVSTNRKDHKISGLRGLIDMLKQNSIDAKDALKPNIAWLSTDINSLLIRNKISSKYIVLLPGSSKNHKSKRWPYYKKLAQILILKKFEVVTILGPEELDLEQSMPGLVLKNLDWRQLSGVIENSYFIFGNDSGPSHIASCLNKFGLALFGPSTSAKRSELKKGKFNILETDDLSKLGADEIFKKMITNISKY